MNIVNDASEAISGALTRAAPLPPVAVTGATIMGIPVPDLVQWLTLAYLVVLIGHKLIQIIKEFLSESSK